MWLLRCPASGVVASERARRVRRSTLSLEISSMTHRYWALVLAALVSAAGSAAAQGAPAAGPSATAPSAAPARPASAPFASITYDRTGVGDTSLFAPLALTAPNIYRSGSAAPGP